ncbi:MAG TPA: hypothetical protein VFD72_05665, partial [Sphingobacteriaceae bacterium]|nr:hypothetical protein [Sphingobacteriaceae bacterium]
MSLFLIVFLGTESIQAQDSSDTWTFYMAFEDATGARDTFWVVWSEQGHAGYADPDLGEVQIELDNTTFTVWKEQFEFGQYYDHYVSELDGATNFSLGANNYVLPLTASWDTSLFQAEILHEVFGFGVNDARLENEYMPLETGFNMLETDHVEMPWFPWGSQSHFPLFVYISCGPTDDVPT